MGGACPSAYAVNAGLRGETKVECGTGVQERTDKEGAKPLRGASQEEEDGEATEQGHTCCLYQH